MYRLRSTTAKKRKKRENGDDGWSKEEVEGRCSSDEVVSANGSCGDRHTGSRIVVIKSFLCDKCHFNTSSKANLRRHQRNHSIEDAFQSEHCPSTLDESQGDEDGKSECRFEKYNCSQCKYGSSYKHNLLRHELSHSGVKKFKCPLCLATFVSKANMARHIRTLHDGQSQGKDIVVNEGRHSQSKTLVILDSQPEEILVSVGGRDKGVLDGPQEEELKSHGVKPRVKDTEKWEHDDISEDTKLENTDGQCQVKKKKLVRNDNQLASDNPGYHDVRTRVTKRNHKDQTNQQRQVEDKAHHDEQPLRDKKSIILNALSRKKKRSMRQNCNSPEKNMSNGNSSFCKNKTLSAIGVKFKCSLCNSPFQLKRDLFSHIDKCHSKKRFRCKCCERCRPTVKSNHKMRFHNQNALFQQRKIVTLSDTSPSVEKSEVTTPLTTLLNNGIVEVIVKTILSTLTLQQNVETLPEVITSGITGIIKADKEPHDDLLSMDWPTVHHQNDQPEKPFFEPTPTGIAPMKDQELFPCKLCDKSFARSRNLRNHVYRVHREPRHECDTCGKKYKRKESLRSHINTHGCTTASDSRQPQANKSFQCESCESRFICRSYLVNHVSRVHTDQRFSCDLCDLIYKRKETLKLHRMIKHPDYSPLV